MRAHVCFAPSNSASGCTRLHLRAASAQRTAEGGAARERGVPPPLPRRAREGRALLAESRLDAVDVERQSAHVFAAQPAAAQISTGGVARYRHASECAACLGTSRVRRTGRACCMRRACRHCSSSPAPDMPRRRGGRLRSRVRERRQHGGRMRPARRPPPAACQAWRCRAVAAAAAARRGRRGRCRVERGAQPAQNAAARGVRQWRTHRRAPAPQRHRGRRPAWPQVHER